MAKILRPAPKNVRTVARHTCANCAALVEFELSDLQDVTFRGESQRTKAAQCPACKAWVRERDLAWRAAANQHT